MSPILLLRLVLLAISGPFVLLLAAGDLGWTRGWIFTGYMVTYTLWSRLAILGKNPDLITERIEALKRDNIEPWDRVLVPVLGVLLPTAAVLLAGLDRRFGWSPELPLWSQAGAYIPMTLGALLAQWAVMANPYFSAVVRIQEERGHRVVATGPYRFVRHPGYAGGLLFHLFIPFALGSLWTFLPVFANLVLTVVRTSLEDKTLLRKLAGYREYATETRRRLLPGIW